MNRLPEHVDDLLMHLQGRQDAPLLRAVRRARAGTGWDVVLVVDGGYDRLDAEAMAAGFWQDRLDDVLVDLDMERHGIDAKRWGR